MVGPLSLGRHVASWGCICWEAHIAFGLKDGEYWWCSAKRVLPLCPLETLANFVVAVARAHLFVALDIALSPEPRWSALGCLSPPSPGPEGSVGGWWGGPSARRIHGVPPPPCPGPEGPDGVRWDGPMAMGCLPRLAPARKGQMVLAGMVPWHSRWGASPAVTGPGRVSVLGTWLRPIGTGTHWWRQGGPVG